MTIFYSDISSFQSGVPLRGLLAVAVKATEGTGYTNPDYEPAKVRAAESGAFLVAYHFLLKGSAAAQAAHAHSVAGSTPLMLDVEAEGSSNPGVSDVVDFVNAYRALGGTVYLVYLPQWYWRNNLGSPSLAPLNSLGLLLVSSQYTTYGDRGPGWNSYGGMSPVVWQYTSTGVLNGFRNVDWNAFKGSLNDFKSLVTTGALAGPDPLLRQGDTGPSVKTLQERLNIWGASPQLTADGVFGAKTYDAVKTFQAVHKLVVDGTVGPNTWKALNASPGGAGTGPKPYPAPANVIAGPVSIAVKWDAVTVDGKPVASYTVQAVGMNGQVFVHEVADTNSAVLTGLVHGWTYNILVWANGGPVAPPHATVKVSV